MTRKADKVALVGKRFLKHSGKDQVSPKKSAAGFDLASAQRAVGNVPQASPGQIISLQYLAGNRAVSRAIDSARTGAANAVGPSLKEGPSIRRKLEAGWEARVEEKLKNLPSGKHAMEVRKKYKVGLALTVGAGSYFDQSANTVSVNPSKNEDEAALTYIHEMNHAEYFHKGQTATGKEKTLTKDKYVAQMLEEEAEGTVKSIEATVEAAGVKGAETLSGTNYALKAVYYKAVEKAKKDNPKLTPVELRSIGKAAVVKGFETGAVVASTSGQTYPEFYGQEWEAAQK